MNVRQFIPPAMRAVLRPVAYVILDAADFVTGKSDPLIPPRRKSFIGSGDYREEGNRFFGFFKEIGKLLPNETVLDVGCGIGRMAVPLTGYLTEGRYEGFDIVQTGIDWCQKRITPRFPNFHFQVADVHNDMYSPKGRYEPSEYRFPYDDSTFDFVFLTSVFTHMFPDDVANYVSEISRVMKPEGRCFITYFLWNSEAEQNTALNLADRHFHYDLGTHRIENPKQPEFAVGLPEDRIRSLYGDVGLQIQEPILYGHWSGRKQFTTYQDIVMATKRR